MKNQILDLWDDLKAWAKAHVAISCVLVCALAVILIAAVAQ